MLSLCHVPVARRARSTVAVLATMFVAPLPDVIEESKRQGSAGLIAVVGHWTDTTASGAAVVVNGERWSGTTTADDLRKASDRLFGSTVETFLSNGGAAGAFPFAYRRRRGVPERHAAGAVQHDRWQVRPDRGPACSGCARRASTSTSATTRRTGTSRSGSSPTGSASAQARRGAQADPVRHVARAGGRGARAPGARLHRRRPDDLGGAHARCRPVGRVGVWAKRDAITAFRGFTAVGSAR